MIPKGGNGKGAQPKLREVEHRNEGGEKVLRGAPSKGPEGLVLCSARLNKIVALSCASNL